MACLSDKVRGVNVWDDEWGEQPEDWVEEVG